MTTNDPWGYELRVAGHLDDRWSSWFGELTIARHDDGTCTLTGPVVDQAQLHGILAGLRDIGATLVSLRVLDHNDGQGATASTTDRRPVQPRWVPPRHVGASPTD